MNEIFTKFVKENYARCLMNMTYPKNSMHINEFIEKSFDKSDPHDTVNSFARLIMNNITHISFPKFAEHIEAAAKEINERLLNKINNSAYSSYEVNFIIPGEFDKSNLWVAILANPFLDAKLSPSRIIGKDELPNDVQTIIDTKQKLYIYIYFDDMSYSGTQFNYNNYFFINKFPGGILPANVDYSLLIGSISTVALRNLDIKTRRIFASKHTLVYKNMQEIMNEEKLTMPDYENRNYKIAKTFDGGLSADNPNCVTKYMQVYWQMFPSLTPVYFDHKLADNVSTFTKLFRSGVYFNINENKEVNTGFVGPLISSCSHCGIEVNETVFDISSIDNTKCPVCPPNFYKNIQYTYMGRNLKSKNINTKLFFDSIKNNNLDLVLNPNA